jgi:1,4-alpha-glucan branching enzyme
MKRLLLLTIALVCGIFSFAQLLTWAPAFPKETDPITMTIDASKGNQALLNYTPTTDVYVHIGVITNKSTDQNDWKYVPFTWGITTAAANASYTGPNKWTYTISGSLRNFFGITDPTETILKIAILFRSGEGSKAQRNTDGSNMYIPVYPSDLAVRLNRPPREPKYIPVPEQQTWNIGTSFTISADASKASAMKLYHNGVVIASSAGNVTTLSGNASITAAGNQQIVAEANDGTHTTYDTINIFVAPIIIAPLPDGVKEGINYDGNHTSVTLVLNAPQKTRVAIIGEFPGSNWSEQSQYVMNRTPDGNWWWLRINHLTPGTEYAYQYLVDGTLKIADPYAEKVLDPGPFADVQIPASTYPNLKSYPTGLTSGIVSVLQTAPPAYNWRITNFTKPDQKGLIIYELLLRDFIAAHDWKTLKDTLSYLKRLGVNAIEIMPFTEFENNHSWGYNTFQYFAPDKYYGPKNTLKEFIDSCHNNGIAVIMDIVLNHTYGPSPLRDLYWDAQNNRPAANNPWYNPVKPHAFGFGEDFNHESANTKYFFNRVLQHWITEYKVDGYRVDFSKGLTQKSSRDDDSFSAYDASRIAILKNYVATVRATDPNAYIILEHLVENSEEKELSENGMMLWARAWTQFQEASMGHLGNSNFQESIHTARGWTNPHLVGFMESHDEERITYKNIKYGNAAGSYHVKDTATALKRMELTAAFLMAIPGPKMIWQFGELGYDYSRCYLSTGGDESGDCDQKTAPKPIRWDYQDDKRRRSVYDVYSQMARLRNHAWYKNVFMSNNVTQSLAGGFKWIKLTTDTSSLVVIGNFDVVPQTGTVIFPSAGTWYDYFGNFIHTATGSAQSFTLQPGEYHVYVSRNVNNVTATPVTNVPWNGTTLEAKLYPNPVSNGTYYVEVKLPQSGKTTVELYNSVGQFVTTVYNGFLANGTRVLTLRGLEVAAGAYFLKVQSKDKTRTIPLTIQ